MREEGTAVDNDSLRDGGEPLVDFQTNCAEPRRKKCCQIATRKGQLGSRRAESDDYAE